MGSRSSKSSSANRARTTQIGQRLAKWRLPAAQPSQKARSLRIKLTISPQSVLDRPLYDRLAAVHQRERARLLRGFAQRGLDSLVIERHDGPRPAVTDPGPSGKPSEPETTRQEPGPASLATTPTRSTEFDVILKHVIHFTDTGSDEDG
ncbi:MAG: hypothetical protein AB1411_02675 [Nitrospirota bacterium]